MNPPQSLVPWLNDISVTVLLVVVTSRATYNHNVARLQHPAFCGRLALWAAQKEQEV